MFCLALKLGGQGLRHAIHDGVGIVNSGAHQSVSNQSGGVGIEGWDECGEELGCGTDRTGISGLHVC